MSYTETKQLAAQLHQRCANEGAPMGSKEFDACMQQEITREATLRHEAKIHAAHRRRALAGAMQAMSDYEYSRAATYRRPTYCTSTPSSSWVGGPVSQVRTTCY